MIKGIDVSSYQTDINWETARNSDINFAILRCGYGDNVEKQDDKKFKRNVAECERLGIPYGVYLYSYALSEEQKQSEIEHVLRLLEGTNPKYPVYLDVEDNSQIEMGKEWITNMCVNFCENLKSKGYKTGIYANQNWLTNYIDTDRLNDYEIWIANYGNNNGDLHELNYTGRYQIHQYTSIGKIDGINGNVDMNVCYVDYLEGNDVQPLEPTLDKIDVIYQTYTNGRWQPNVKNTEDYAGVFGLTVTGVYANLSEGNIIYKVHTKNGKWLPEVTNRNDYAGILGKNIDGLMMRTDNKNLRYRVHLLNGKWLPWVAGYSEKDSINGYAGIFGKAIDAIQVEIV